MWLGGSSSCCAACFCVYLQTFQEDWIAESPAAAASRGKPAEQPSFSQQRAATRDTNFGPGAQDQQQEAPDIVRPGRLLTTLHAMRQELEVQLVSSGGSRTHRLPGTMFD
jgi:hypothetical protein